MADYLLSFFTSSLIFHALITLQTVEGHPDVKESEFEQLLENFDGKKFWDKFVIDSCDTKTDKFHFNQSSEPYLSCYVYQVNLNFVKAEVVSLDPPLIKLHRFFPKYLVKEFKHYTRNFVHKDLLVKDKEKEGIVKLESRTAKGVFLRHNYSSITQQAFDFVQARFPAINFETAENFQVLNYKPGGHYAPHWDFFATNPDLELKGNRIITFMVILQIAQSGGGTTYPYAGYTFQPRPGDAVLWFNQNPDYSKARNSIHGACPVFKGEKIGLTLWVRSKGQLLTYPCPLREHAPFSVDPIVKPKSRVFTN